MPLCIISKHSSLVSAADLESPPYLQDYCNPILASLSSSTSPKRSDVLIVMHYYYVIIHLIVDSSDGITC